jgi:hypothetical protein
VPVTVACIARPVASRLTVAGLMTVRCAERVCIEQVVRHKIEAAPVHERDSLVSERRIGGERGLVFIVRVVIDGRHMPHRESLLHNRFRIAYEC